MADIVTGAPVGGAVDSIPTPPTPFQPPKTLDEARALARERFRSKLKAGEPVAGCDCHAEGEPATAPQRADEPAARVAGVRFRDSGRTYYFAAADFPIDVGDWVVVDTSRGREAGRVIIAPHQVRLNLLQGELKPVLRRLSDDDVRRMAAFKRDAAAAVKTFAAKARSRHLPVKAISAEYSFDGSRLTLNYSVPERERPDLHALANELADTFRCRVELRQVGARDEARLLGGLGRCGRTLCCSSWLPVYPEISMNMAKTQDLPLNPSKVSGVCGRLLCCLSYENEQYKQMKAVMPRLGQPIETPIGPGMVVSMQVLKELVTVRLAANNTDTVFAAADLGLGGRTAAPTAAPPPAEISVADPVPVEPADAGVVALDPGVEPATDDAPTEAASPGEGPGSGRRRRRRRRR